MDDVEIAMMSWKETKQQQQQQQIPGLASYHGEEMRKRENRVVNGCQEQLVRVLAVTAWVKGGKTRAVNKYLCCCSVVVIMGQVRRWI